MKSGSRFDGGQDGDHNGVRFVKIFKTFTQFCYCMMSVYRVWNKIQIDSIVFLPFDTRPTDGSI